VPGLNGIRTKKVVNNEVVDVWNLVSPGGGQNVNSSGARHMAWFLINTIAGLSVWGIVEEES
jgi:hypothetical protein